MNENERWLWAKLDERHMVDDIILEGFKRYLDREDFNRWRMHLDDPSARLTGGYEGPRRDRIPLPAEVANIISQAEAAALAASGWPVIHCGEAFPGVVSGNEVRCTLVQGHTRKIKHRNHDLRVSWWGNDQLAS